jgi:P27 family predicted phage terminase small subunit
MKRETPKAPAFLRAATRRWFDHVASSWMLEQHHLRLLVLACQAWDRCQQARACIAKEGLTTPTREGGHKLHPAVRVEQESMVTFSRLVRELDLDLDPPAAESRPPRLRSITGG